MLDGLRPSYLPHHIVTILSSRDYTTVHQQHNPLSTFIFATRQDDSHASIDDTVLGQWPVARGAV
jgi:hypothetical protein